MSPRAVPDDDLFESLKVPPELMCDLVMKGGISSGVVYPRAIIQLASKYQLKCVGGTSAGAIAAALAAAAEHGRAQGGFRVLDQVARDLPRILTGLFQATPRARPLLDSTLILIKKGRFWRTRLFFTIAFGYFWSAIFGSLLGAGVGAGLGYALMSLSQWLGSVVILAVVGGIGGMILFLLKRVAKGILRDLPEQRFGMCPGGNQPGYAQDALLPWMHRCLNEAAGLEEDRPLTFGDLKGRGITLEVLSTNLAEGRPYRLPMNNRRFFIKKSDFYEIFPREIVDFMVKRAETSGERSPKSDAFLRFPQPEDLPVIVAVRMSLSFPFLLQAVPLYSRDFTLKGETEQRKLRACMFSDGGISSNLPIHFFDSPLPSRPTFAINLEQFDSRRHTEEERVVLPVEAGDGQLLPMNGINDVPQFASGIMNAMQNWQDNLRLIQPGTRERVASIRLDPNQGGLNLEMGAEDVEKLISWGNDAGGLFNDDFDFERHRWRRHLVWWGAWEAAQENVLGKYDPSLLPPGVTAPTINGGVYYEKFLKTYEPAEYKVGAEWRKDTDARVDEVMKSFSELNKANNQFKEANLPKPTQTLKLTPDH